MKQIVPLLLITVIALAFWVYLSYEKKIDDLIAVDDPHFVDLFMRDFTMTAMNEEGTPGFTMHASYLEHYNGEDYSIVTKPVINLLHENNLWLISAKAGKFDTAKNYITLYKDVIMQQQEVLHPVVLRTELLEIDATKQIAKSDQMVYIDQQDLKLQSMGILLDNNTRKLELLASVKGIYVPAK